MDIPELVMDANDMKRYLKSESSACVFTYEVAYHLSSLHLDDPQTGFIIFQPVPGVYDHGVIRTFNSIEEARVQFEAFKADDPSPKYVIRPDAHLKYEGSSFQGKYTGVFEKLDNWLNTFRRKKRSDNDIFEFLGKLGEALQYRYNITGSIGNISEDVVITDSGQVLFWNWAPGSKNFQTEFGILKDCIQDIRVLASKGDRLDAFVSFITDILGGAVPATDWQLLLFNYPIFMVAKQCVRFLEALHNMVCDSAHGLSTETKFVDALAKYDLKWKKYISAGTVEEAVMNFRKGYVGTAVDLPKFTHNCVKHYKETATKMNQKELTQLEVIDKLRSIQGFECLPEDLFKALYKGAVSLANNVQAPNNYSSEKILGMLKVAEGPSP